jgi:phosphate-selective porin OprO and OprP
MKISHPGVVLGGLLLVAGQPTFATDEALLQVLLANKLITQTQYDAIVKASPAEQAPAAAPKAAPKDTDNLLDVLLANGVITKEQYESLTVRTAQDVAEARTARETTASLKDGLKFKSEDGNFSAQIGAYAQLDGAFYGDDNTDLSSGSELRRTRLSVSGTVYKDWDYKIEADLAGTTQGGTTNTETITDAYLRWTGWRPFAITAGSFKVPFSLEAVSSAKYTTFMERGLPFAFLNLRQLGGMISTNGENWTAAAGAFGDSVTSQNSDDEGKGVAGRVTWAPIYGADRVLHLGLGGQWRDPLQNSAGNRRETLRFRAKPESNLASDALTETATLTSAGRTFGRSSGRLVDTGNIGGNVNDYTLLGVELAGVWGPLSLQGEYIRSDVNRDIGDDLAFDGYYVEASWFVTGESRGYKADKGVFDTVRPKSNFALGKGAGAWQLGVRLSGLDLNDGEVDGGDITDLTVGVNWYVNPYMRMMANYVSVLDVEGGAHDGDNPDVFQVRAQVAY